MSRVKGATIGMFDGVHLGHQYLISQLKEQCDEPLVVTFDNHPLWVIRSEHEPQLLLTPREKEGALRSLGVTPVMLRFDDDLRKMTAAEFISRLARDYGIERLILGYDNRIGSDRCDSSDDSRLSRLTGVDIIRAAELPGPLKVNSSAIRKLLSQGDITEAERLLGHPYTLHGIIEHGKQLGRRIGFPTANLRPDHPDKLIPLNGVYAAEVLLPADNSYHKANSVNSDTPDRANHDTVIIGDTTSNILPAEGGKFRAVVNIGNRPTVDPHDSPTTIEAHLDGFTGDLYNRDLTLQFLTRLRSERHFPDLDTLRTAIASDLTTARTLR